MGIVFRPSKRTFLLKPVEILQDMPGDSTNMESDNWIKWYTRRPKALQNCCLADFVSKFDIILPPKEKRKNMNNEYLPEDECDEGDDDDDNVQEQNMSLGLMDFGKEYIMRDGSVLKQRKHQKIIRYVRFNSNQDPENYHREQLMLFLPWRRETEDLLGNQLSYEINYMYHKETIINNRKAYSLDKGVADIAEDNMILSSNENVISAEVQHNEEVDMNTEQHLCLEHGCFNTEACGVSYDLGLDLGITRKQVEINDFFVNSMSDEEYMNLTRNAKCEPKEIPVSRFTQSKDCTTSNV